MYPCTLTVKAAQCGLQPVRCFTDKTYATGGEYRDRRIVFMENLAMINKHNTEERFGLHSYKLAMYEFGDLVSDDTFSRDGLYQCIVYTSTIGHCVRAHAYVCVRMYPTACANVCDVHACVHACMRACVHACIRANTRVRARCVRVCSQ